MITVEFKNFMEMKDFAKELLGMGATEPGFRASEVKTTTIEKGAFVAPAQMEKPVDEPPTEKTAEESEVKYSLEDVRAKLAALNKAGKRDEVKSLLSSFGSEKLSGIAPEDYAELMKKAEGI